MITYGEFVKQAIAVLSPDDIRSMAEELLAGAKAKEDAAMLRDIVADHRDPVQAHSPHVSGSYESVERAERIALAKAEERAAGGNRQH